MSSSCYIVANFKNYGSLGFFHDYLSALRPPSQDRMAILCPPTPYLSSLAHLLPEGYHLGAQDCSAFNEPTITGETRASMLTPLGVTFVILGHSERTTYLMETDSLIAKKIACAQAHRITPIVCIGEPEEIRIKGQTEDFLAQKLTHILPGNTNPAKIILAYEPVWAIGTGRTPSLEDINTVASFLKNKTCPPLESPPPILYGGSVSPQNASSILALPAISGLLVGRASLDVSFWTAF